MLRWTTGHRAPSLLCFPEHNTLTSFRNFSPIPKRVMDGSEPGESVAAAVLSGAPVDLQARTVRYASHITLGE